MDFVANNNGQLEPEIIQESDVNGLSSILNNNSSDIETLSAEVESLPSFTDTSNGPSSSGDLVTLNSQGYLSNSLLTPEDIVVAAGSVTLSSRQIIGSYVAAEINTIPANMVGSVGSSYSPSASGSTFDVMIMSSDSNAQTLIGTIDFAAGEYSPTFSTISGSSYTLNVNDTLQIIAPDTVDSSLAQVSISLVLTPQVNLTTISGGASTLPPNSVVLSYCSTSSLTIPANMVGSVGSAVSPSASGTTFTVYKMSANSSTQTNVGSINFAKGAFTSTFSTVSTEGFVINAGDTLQVIAPPVEDSSLSNISLTILGES